MKHWYESCLGAIYSTDHKKTIEETHCDQCGDCDYYIGQYKTESEAIKALNEDIDIESPENKWF